MKSIIIEQMEIFVAFPLRTAMVYIVTSAVLVRQRNMKMIQCMRMHA